MNEIATAETTEKPDVHDVAHALGRFGELLSEVEELERDLTAKRMQLEELAQETYKAHMAVLAGCELLSTGDELSYYKIRVSFRDAIAAVDNDPPDNQPFRKRIKIVRTENTY